MRECSTFVLVVSRESAELSPRFARDIDALFAKSE